MLDRKRGKLFGLMLAVILVALFMVSVVLDFGLEGTDDQASGAIEELHPEYRPWFGNLFEPGEAAEKFLFALQILLGVGVGWWCLVALRRSKNAR